MVTSAKNYGGLGGHPYTTYDLVLWLDCLMAYDIMTIHSYGLQPLSPMVWWHMVSWPMIPWPKVSWPMIYGLMAYGPMAQGLMAYDLYGLMANILLSCRMNEGQRLVV